MAGVSSLNLVREELEATLDQAESSLEHFIETRSDAALLQSCIEQLQQIRGALTLIEMSGAQMLADELVQLATDIPQDASEACDPLLGGIGKGLFVLKRYLEYLQLSKEELPELLLPSINQLRALRQAPLLPDSHFFPIRLSLNPPLPTVSPYGLSEAETRTLLRRIRQTYQFGLVDLIREQNLTGAAGLMSRALWRLFRLQPELPLARLWWVASVALDAFAEARMAATQSRKRLFAALERQMRNWVNGRQDAAAEPDTALLKELLYLVALSDPKEGRGAELCRAYGMISLPFNEQALRDEQNILSGPGQEVFKSLSLALGEEFNGLKDQLDLISRTPESGQHDFALLLSQISTLAKTLSMVGLHPASAALVGHTTALRGWVQSGRCSHAELMKLADTLLFAESSVAALEHPHAKQHDLLAREQGQEADAIALNQLQEAQIVVVEESRAGLALAKRAITAYIESDWDKMHLANVPSTLSAVRGGLVFMGMGRAAGVLYACVRFIRERVIESDELPSEHMLETLADALTSLEYFLEGAESTRQAASEVLDMADQSLAELGYKAQA